LFFERVKIGEIVIIVSDVLKAKLIRASAFVTKLLPGIPQK
jgi:hypothetical protein